MSDEKQLPPTNVRGFELGHAVMGADSSPVSTVTRSQYQGIGYSDVEIETLIEKGVIQINAMDWQR